MAVLRLAGALLLVLAAALAGCTRDPLEIRPAADQLMVHGVLTAGDDTVVIQLTEIRAEGRGAFLRTRGVGGAHVELAGVGSVTRVPELLASSDRCLIGPPEAWDPERTPDSHGCYLAVLPAPLLAGEHYELRVTTTDGRRASGATRIPTTPVLLRPADGSRMTAVPSSRAALETDSTVRLHWRVDAPAAMLIVSTRAEAAFRGATAVPNLLCDAVLEARFRNQWGDETIDPQFTDSLRQRVVVRGCATPNGPLSRDVRPDSVRVRIRVAAYDTAFVRYQELLRSGTSVRWSEAAVGLQGAVGVFASTAAADLRLMVLRRHEPGPGSVAP